MRKSLVWRNNFSAWRKVRPIYVVIQNSAIEQAGIPFTFHWGKLHETDSDRVRRMYGQRVDRWLAARRTLLATPELRRLFANGYTDRAGLSD